MINDILSNVKNILICILLIIVSLMIFNKCSLEKELENNTVILTDSLYDYKNKLDEVYKQKELYITNIENLERINKELYDEVKNLKDNPIVITKTETIVKIDSVYIKSEPIIDSLNNNIINNYQSKDDYLSMDITHRLANNEGLLSVNNILMQANLSHSIIEDKKTKKLSIITKSDNPYLMINDINGGFIGLDDSKTLKNHYKRDTRWALSVNGGYGITYDMKNNNMVVGPTMSFGVSYLIFKW